MKKILVLGLVLVLILSFSGCAKSEELKAAEAAIAQLGTITLESENAIATAENALNALTEEDLAKLKNPQVVDEARATYEKLVLEKVAGDVDTLIDSIGTVTLESKAVIDDAFSSYDTLSDEAKELVVGYDKLQDANETYAALVVDKAINSIGDVTVDSKDVIEEAYISYNALSEVAKSKVTALAVLEKAQETLHLKRAENVSGIIDQLGIITLKSQNKIEDARKAYNELNADEKTLIKNLNVLEDAEKKFDDLKEAEKEKALASLKSDFNVEVAKVQGVTWYQPKGMPKYIDTRCYALPYVGVTNYGAWICMRYNYTEDDWIFWKTLTIMVDGEKEYKSPGYFNITRDNDGGLVWEYYDEILSVNADMNNVDIELLRDIAESDETIIRFSGDDYHYDLTVSSKDKETIKTVLAAYEVLKK